MIESILTFLQIVKTGLDIIDQFRPGSKGKVNVGPDAAATFRRTVQSQHGGKIAQRIKSDPDVQKGLNLMASALADWQVSSTPLCPLLLRKTVSFGTEEKNLGFVPATEDQEFVEQTYSQWKAWIDKGPRNNEGLLVFLLDSPHREIIDLIRELNKRKTGFYHKPRFGCLDVRSGTFYGPPRGFMDQYLMGFGVDSFWNEIMKGIGYLIA
ncbi:MAG: hypothetical protein JW837_07645 [Sedimentisphaerales bacterium]|nr:hypothetical protein [Sedimentisphaerales bacterium]